MTTTPDTTVAEALETEIRRHMACVTKARGYDSQCIRDLDLAALDKLLDRHNWLTLGR